MKKDINIMFCPKCNWKLINGDELGDKTNRCPKCKSWTFEISQNYYYKKGKLIAKEFEITDNDEMGFHTDDWREAKRIIDKAFKLFAIQQQGEQK